MSINELVQKFSFTRLLKSDPQTKSIALLGTIDSQDAIMSLEKSHFDTDAFQLQSAVSDVHEINHNDVYYWSLTSLNQQLPDVPGAKLNLIYPATETHIRKFAFQKFHLVEETPEIYKTKVEPYIQTMKGDRIKWVYNILFEGKEAESVVHHDKDPQDGFVLLPDMKWDGINMDSLYLCAIVTRLDISSVRDLNASHLDYLVAIRNQIKKAASEKYAIDDDQLRLFIHYQPSYYHFHIHVVNVTHPGLGNGIAVGKAILLDDVIENIRLVGDYYQKRTLSYVLGENHDLWAKAFAD